MRPDEVILSENGSPVANPLSRAGGNGAPIFSFGKEFLLPSSSSSNSSIAHLKETGGRDTARNSSSTSGTRSSTLTAVNSLRDSASTAVFGGNGLMMLQVKTASGGMLAFDPLQTMPGALIFIHSSEIDGI